MAGKFTKEQSECIESTQPRVIISAAAGTGKTFTITQKIGWMIENGLIDSVDQILAITFTNKAAGEIKARVRSTLRSKGLHEQALLVDGAWISTIHSMCSRILKSHALEFGIDPSFAVVDDMESAKLMDQAIDSVVTEDSQKGPDSKYSGIFSEYPVSSAGQQGVSVTGVLGKLLNAYSMTKDGFDAMDIGPKPQSLVQIVQSLHTVLSDSMVIYNSSKCTGAAFEKGLNQRVCLLQKLDESLEHPEEITWQWFVELLGETGSLGKMRGKKFPEINERFEEDRMAFGSACCNLLGLKSRDSLVEFVDLSKEVEREYMRLKSSQGLLDQDDLLLETYRQLASHPDIADEYKNQFKLILVDEFQDTSQMQIDIISMLTGDETQLCTVGDAQQSIYRFRGADVNVYREFNASAGVDPVKLNLNFRSHGDVLAFSNSIFGQPDVFGDMFLKLNPGRKSQEDDYYGMPRIKMISVQYDFNKGGMPSSADLLQHEAAAIAQTFSDYREKGCSPGDMVVLLGRMTNAGVYSQALRAQGFDVVVAGGSGFWAGAEAQLVSSILKVLANPSDREGIYGVLQSQMVPIGDDDLISLIHGDGGRRIPLEKGFARVDERESPELQLLKRVINQGRSSIGRSNLSDIVKDILVESGYVGRLQKLGASGVSACANLMKALRYISDAEEEGKGISQISRMFIEQVGDGGKDGPGVLMSGEGGAVRIMTIHASKGLEFPIVALAEYNSMPRGKSFTAEAYGGRVYLSLNPGRSTNSAPKVEQSAKAYMDEALDKTVESSRTRFSKTSDYPEFRASLRYFGSKEELDELKRRFYVGITRASEALVVCASCRVSNNGLAEGSILGDMSTAFFGANALPTSDCTFEYGGSAPAAYKYIKIEKDENGRVFRVEDPEYELPRAMESAESNLIPEFEKIVRPVARGGSKSEESGLFSYSSIADHSGAGHGNTTGADESGDAAHTDSPVASEDYPSEDRPYLSESVGHPSTPIYTDDEQHQLFADEDSATELGLAFHSTAEFMALSGMLGGSTAVLNPSAGTGNVQRPSSKRVDAIAKSYQLSGSQHVRLVLAVDAWVSSDTARLAATYPRIRAEVPFCIRFPRDAGATSGSVSIGTPNPAYLNGEIDLLCTNGHEAFIVDYKTGGSDSETPEQLHEKHLLQSLCYAYAVLSSGIKHVKMSFVRVERVDDKGHPQTVDYEYSLDDFDEIEGCIASALERKAQ